MQYRVTLHDHWGPTSSNFNALQLALDHIGNQSCCLGSTVDRITIEVVL